MDPSYAAPPSPTHAPQHQALRALFAAGQVALAVGPDVSVAASGAAPGATWPGLLCAGAERAVTLRRLTEAQGRALIEDLKHGSLNDQLRAGEQVWGALTSRGRGPLKTWLSEAVGALPLVDPTLLDAIVRLRVPTLTSNLDSLLEQRSGRSPLTWWDHPPEVMRWLRGGSRSVLHVLGHWARFNTLVLDHRDYRLDFDELAAHVRGVLGTSRSLVLVGCGAAPEGPDVQLLLHWCRSIGATPDHRRVLLGLEEEADGLKSLCEAHDLELIVVGRTLADLTALLVDLAPPRPVSARRLEDWGAPDDGSPAAPLADLLTHLFETPSQLWAHLIQIHENLGVDADPRGGVSLHRFASTCADALDRQRLVNRPLFAALASTFPADEPEIRDVEARILGPRP